MFFKLNIIKNYKKHKQKVQHKRFLLKKTNITSLKINR